MLCALLLVSKISFDSGELHTPPRAKPAAAPAGVASDDGVWCYPRGNPEEVEAKWVEFWTAVQFVKAIIDEPGSWIGDFPRPMVGILEIQEMSEVLEIVEILEILEVLEILDMLEVLELWQILEIFWLSLWLLYFCCVFCCG